MAVRPEILVENITSLWLDPRNPRLGRAVISEHPDQAKLLDILESWSLVELGRSIAKSGLWPQEPLIAVKETIDGGERLVVVEGNRRLAAAKLLLAAIDGHPRGSAWQDVAAGADRARTIRAYCMLADAREDVDTYLGFRHVTGIREWHPAEKAEFIAELVDRRSMSYSEVAKAIGSNTPTVIRNYVAFKMLSQIERAQLTEFAESVEERFSVLFLALRNKPVQEFLGLSLEKSPAEYQNPIPEAYMENLQDLVRWLFGISGEERVVKDSRQVDAFAKVLSVPDAVHYLRTTPNATLEVANRIAGGEAAQTADALESAAYSLEESLAVLHLNARDARVIRGAVRVAKDVKQIASIIPEASAELRHG